MSSKMPGGKGTKKRRRFDLEDFFLTLLIAPIVCLALLLGLLDYVVDRLNWRRDLCAK